MEGSALGMVTPRALAHLARRSGRGDTVAFADLYHALYDMVAERAHARLDDPRLARTAVCATFIEVWHMAGFHAGARADVRAWVCAVADERIRQLAADRGVATTAHTPDPWWAGFAGMRTETQLLELDALLRFPGGCR